jgi:uncharacterized protein (TIGR02118 family)
MTLTLLAVYSQPEDPAAFDEHYRTVHTPLTQAIPHLESLKVRRVAQTMAGEGIYMLAEMVFADRQAFEAAAGTPECRATGKDLKNFAAGRVSLHIIDHAA